MFFHFLLNFLVLFYYNIFSRYQKKLMKIADLLDFKTGQIVGAHMAGASVTIARSTVSTVMTGFEKKGKTLLNKIKLSKKAKGF